MTAQKKFIISSFILGCLLIIAMAYKFMLWKNLISENNLSFYISLVISIGIVLLCVVSDHYRVVLNLDSRVRVVYTILGVVAFILI